MAPVIRIVKTVWVAGTVTHCVESRNSAKQRYTKYLNCLTSPDVWKSLQRRLFLCNFISKIFCRGNQSHSVNKPLRNREAFRKLQAPWSQTLKSEGSGFKSTWRMGGRPSFPWNCVPLAKNLPWMRVLASCAAHKGVSLECGGSLVHVWWLGKASLFR